jgi:dolichol kinase
MKKINLVRSLIHLSGFLTIFLRINLGLTFVLLLITVTSIIYCFSEFLRLKGKTFPLIKLTIKAAKDEEKKSFIIKPIYYAIGIASALILFPNSIGNSAIAILTIGDSLAGLSGTIIGKTPIPYNKNKTVEGSLIGFSIAFFAANLFSPMKIALIGAFVGALTESYDKFIEDNLFIPLVSGFIMWMSSFFIL